MYGAAVETVCHATGYDAYVGHTRMAEVLVEAAELQSALGRWDEAVRNLERAAHIYTASTEQVASSSRIDRRDGGH